MFCIPIHTGFTENRSYRELPYVCKSTLQDMFEYDDTPTIGDVVLKQRKRGENPPNSCATKICIPENFENSGVDYQMNGSKWVRQQMLTLSADEGLRVAGVPVGNY